MIRKMKIVLVLMIAILSVSVLASTVVQAAKVDDGGMDWASDVATMEKNAGNENWGKNDATDSVDGMVANIISVVRVIAIGVAIIMLTVLAMKYLMAAPGDKADIKKHAVVYVVGAVVLFGISGILGIIAEFASSIKVA